MLLALLLCAATVEDAVVDARRTPSEFTESLSRALGKLDEATLRQGLGFEDPNGRLADHVRMLVATSVHPTSPLTPSEIAAVQRAIGAASERTRGFFIVLLSLDARGRAALIASLPDAPPPLAAQIAIALDAESFDRARLDDRLWQAYAATHEAWVMRYVMVRKMRDRLRVKTHADVARGTLDQTDAFLYFDMGGAADEIAAWANATVSAIAGPATMVAMTREVPGGREIAERALARRDLGGEAERFAAAYLGRVDKQSAAKHVRRLLSPTDREGTEAALAAMAWLPGVWRRKVLEKWQKDLALATFDDPAWRPLIDSARRMIADDAGLRRERDDDGLCPTARGRRHQAEWDTKMLAGTLQPDE